MLFNSYIFIFVFLPIALTLYFTLYHFEQEKLAKASLVLMSLWFYGYFNPAYLLIICSSVLVNFTFSKFMNRCDMKSPRRKVFLVLGILFNVGLIFYFKYYDFFIENLNLAFKTDFVLKHIALPLGISFFTFQQISFIVDSYRGETKGYDFIEYALFVTFFPQLVAGPIVLHSELIPQFRNRSKWSVNYENLSRGLVLFARGMAKKVLVADALGRAVEWGMSQADSIPVGEGALTISEIIIVMLSYTFQIYFDFSGYSDMATGLGSMFNLEIPMNFNSPYKALSVADFWKRWHMTLTRFLTTYIYIPLGGSRRGKARTYINTMLVFLISGIWHGANWTFILWGVLHGIAQCFNKLTGKAYNTCLEKIGSSAPGKAVVGLFHAGQWFVTFVFLNVTWLLFRAESVLKWQQILRRLFVLNLDIRDDLIDSFRIPKLRYILSFVGLELDSATILYISLVAAFVFIFGLCLMFENNYKRKIKLNGVTMFTTWLLLVICIVSLSSISKFLYFNF